MKVAFEHYVLQTDCLVHVAAVPSTIGNKQVLSLKCGVVLQVEAISEGSDGPTRAA